MYKSNKLNIFMFLLGFVFFIVTMWESFYPHDSQSITICFGPYLGPLPHHNMFTLVMGIISLALLSYSGFRLFKTLPKVDKLDRGLNFSGDTKDLDIHS